MVLFSFAGIFPGSFEEWQVPEQLRADATQSTRRACSANQTIRSLSAHSYPVAKLKLFLRLWPRHTIYHCSS
jgi:hypothetical protein